MSLLEDMLTAIRGRAEQLGLPPPEIGPLPAEDSGIGMFLLGGRPDEFLNRKRSDVQLLSVNTKSPNGHTALEYAEKMIDILTGSDSVMPPGVSAIHINTPCSFVDRDSAGSYIYNVVFDVLY